MAEHPGIWESLWVMHFIDAQAVASTGVERVTSTCWYELLKSGLRDTYEHRAVFSRYGGIHFVLEIAVYVGIVVNERCAAERIRRSVFWYSFCECGRLLASWILLLFCRGLISCFSAFVVFGVIN